MAAAATATITSKGQITIPRDIRDRLGLHQGDELEFLVQEDGTTVIRRAQPIENPFLKWVGGFGPLPDGMTSVEWVREMRGHDEFDHRD